MGIFVAFLRWLRDQGDAVFDRIVDLLQEAVNLGGQVLIMAAPLVNRLRRMWWFCLGVIIFLLVLTGGGFLIHNLWLKVIPVSLIAVVFYTMLTVLQWIPRRFANQQDKQDMPWEAWKDLSKEQRQEWKQEYSRDYHLSLAVRGINGWLFWIIGILDLLMLIEPWQAKVNALVFGFLFLCWTYAHLFRFLGTLRITIKIVFVVILTLLFMLRLGIETNNEVALRFASSVHLWEAGSRITRARHDIEKEELDQQAISLPKYRVYEVRQGAALIKEMTNSELKGETASEGLLLWVPENQSAFTQPDKLLGPHKFVYKIKEEGGVRFFEADKDLAVWVRTVDLVRLVELEESVKIQKRTQQIGKGSHNSGNESRGILSQLERIQIDKARAVWYGLWLGVVLVGLYLVWKKLKNKAMRGLATVLLLVIAVWLGLAGLANAVSLAPAPVVSSVSTGLASTGNGIIQQPTSQTAREKVVADQWLVVDRISATSRELAEGVALPDGSGLILKWPRWAFLRYRVKGSNSGWARGLPWGDNYYVGFKNGIDVVLHGRMRRYFENNGLSGYAVCLAQEGELIKSWPLTVNQLPEDNRTGISPEVINLPVFQIPAGTNRMLRVNKPFDIKAGIEWDDDFLIILEVVEYQTSYGAFINERPFFVPYWILK